MDLIIESPGHFYVGYLVESAQGLDKPFLKPNQADLMNYRMLLDGANGYEQKHCTMAYLGPGHARFGMHMFSLLDALVLPAVITVPVKRVEPFGSQLALALEPTDALLQASGQIHDILRTLNLLPDKPFNPHVSFGPRNSYEVRQVATHLTKMPEVTLYSPYIRFRDRRYPVRTELS